MSADRERVRRAWGSRWLPWLLFGVSAFVGLILLVTTAAVAGSKTIPVPGPTVTVQAAAKPTPAETVTVAADDSAQVSALETQLQQCNSAWQHIAKRETDALSSYNDSVMSIVNAVENGDASKLQDATNSIQEANSTIDEITPKVDEANATCTP